MKALTLKRPWDVAIAHCGKRIENRKWRPRSLEIGETFALHAGKGWDHEGAARIWSRYPSAREIQSIPSVVFALADLGEVVDRSSDPWFFGPFGWKLENVRLIEPIEAKGMLGLWEWPDAPEGE